MEKLNVGELIKSERKKRGLSIQALADLTGLSKSYLSQVENNKRGLSYETIHKLKNVLNIDFHYFSWVAGLYSDQEYKDFLAQTKTNRSMSPDELLKSEQHNHVNNMYKLEKFKKKKYVRIEDFLNNDIESFFIGDHRLTNEEIRMLIHLFEGKKKNYPTPEEIEKEFITLKARKKIDDEKIKNGEAVFIFNEYHDYDLD